jgi:aldose sugar dehydrogenase
MTTGSEKKSGKSRTIATFLRRGILVGSIALIIFGAGFAAHKYYRTSRHFPFPQIRSIETRIGAHPDPVEALSRQYSNDIRKIELDRSVDTGLLPLKIKGIRLSDHFSVPKIGGAVTSIGEVVIILDRLGSLYSYAPSDGQIKRLPFPELPNHLSEYLAEPGAVLDGKRFRAYDIKYLGFAKKLVVSHEYFDHELRKSRLAVSTISIDENAIRPSGGWDTIFLGDPEFDGPNENGAGRLAAQESETIFLAVGDYLVTSGKVSQDPTSTFGKIIAININTGRTHIVSRGHRNPEGLVRTRDGTMWSTEHGPNGGDELNLVVEGANYGWPNVSLGTDYGSYDFEGQLVAGDHSGYSAPVFAWVPSIGTSNLIEIDGFDRRWDGDLLVASLKAASLFRLRLDGTRVLYSEPIWIGQRLRDVTQTKNGYIVLWTDDTQLLLISVDRERLNRNVRVIKQLSNALNGWCMYCHHFGNTTPSDSAPTLTNLFSRRIGTDNFRYSAGLRNKSGQWTAELLKQFIADPEKFANGTSMPRLNLDKETIDEIVSDLEDIDRATKHVNTSPD